MSDAGDPDAAPDVESALREAIRSMPTVVLRGNGGETSRVAIRPELGGSRARAAAGTAVGGGLGQRLHALAQRVRSLPPSVFGGVVPEIVAIQVHHDEEQGDAVSKSAQTAPTQADSYGVGLPEGWIAQPLDPATFERGIDSQKAQLRSQGVGVAEIRKFELLQRQIHGQMLAEQVQYVATLAGRGPADEETGGGDGDDHDVTLLLAGMVLTTRTRASLGAPQPITVDLLLRSFGGTGTLEEGINLEEPAKVALPAGDAFRLVRFHSASAAGAELLEYYEHAYLVPHDGGERVAFLQFVTPSLGYSEPLGELFDAMATTLRIFYPDDPTTFESTGSEDGR